MKVQLLLTQEVLTLIEYLPQLQHDEKNVNDCANEPHELTHICDALRYFCVSRIRPTELINPKPETIYDYFNLNEEESELGEIVVI